MSLLLNVEELRRTHIAIFKNECLHEKRNYVSSYGMDLFQIAKTLELIQKHNKDYYDTCKSEKKVSAKHVLMALYFLKNYTLEDNIASIFGGTRKTNRKWIWKTVELICNVDNVSAYKTKKQYNTCI